jgi:hypothetical protein
VNDETDPAGAGGWDARLLPLLTDEWQSADALAARLKAPQFTVLARLKDMMRRNLVERRLVKKPGPPVKRPDGKRAQPMQAEFRRFPL